MAFSEEVALLDEYNRWRAGRKGDTTPEKFLSERASETALARLIAVEEYVDGFDSIVGKVGGMEHHSVKMVIKQILNGDR